MIFPVWLTADAGALLSRVDAPERAQRSKLTDATVLQDLLEVPLLAAPEDALTIDTTQIAPAQAVTQILESLR